MQHTIHALKFDSNPYPVEMPIFQQACYNAFFPGDMTTGCQLKPCSTYSFRTVCVPCLTFVSLLGLKYQLLVTTRSVYPQCIYLYFFTYLHTKPLINKQRIIFSYYIL